MTDPKDIFQALPHINTIWVTEDGNFHLHKHNGGVEVTRESIEASENLTNDDEQEESQEDATDSEKEAEQPEPKSAKETIALIEQATTPEQVIEILGADSRVTVKTAADKKIASF